MSSWSLELIAQDSQDVAELSVAICQPGSGDEQEKFRLAWGSGQQTH